MCIYVTLRDWTDLRDGRPWKIRQTGLPPVVVFASEGELYSALIDFSRGLVGRSDKDLLGLLNEGRG